MGYWQGNTWIPDDVVPVAASMSRASSQSIPNTAVTLVQLSSSDLVSGGLFAPTVDASTNYRITIAKSGVYQVSFWGSYNTSGPNFIGRVHLYENGSQVYYSEHHVDGTGVYQLGSTRLLSLVAGDYLDLRTWQNSGINQSLILSSLDVHLLR